MLAVVFVFVLCMQQLIKDRGWSQQPVTADLDMNSELKTWR